MTTRRGEALVSCQQRRVEHFRQSDAGRIVGA
jgi:hypothetical protein